jgi:hypothetical protein
MEENKKEMDCDVDLRNVIEVKVFVEEEEKPKDLNIFQSEKVGAGSKGPGEK